MVKERNCFPDTGKVIFSVGNRKQSESGTETSWNNFRDRHKEICKINGFWALDEFKSRHIYRRNKMAVTAVVR